MKMIIRISALLFFMFFIASVSGYNRDDITEYKFYVLSDFKYNFSDFKENITDIRRCHPQYSVKDILETIIIAYNKIKEKRSDVDIKEVVEGIERFADDNLGIDFKDLVSAYIKSQIK